MGRVLFCALPFFSSLSSTGYCGEQLKFSSTFPSASAIYRRLRAVLWMGNTWKSKVCRQSAACVVCWNKFTRDPFTTHRVRSTCMNRKKEPLSDGQKPSIPFGGCESPHYRHCCRLATRVNLILSDWHWLPVSSSQRMRTDALKASLFVAFYAEHMEKGPWDGSPPHKYNVISCSLLFAIPIDTMCWISSSKCETSTCKQLGHDINNAHVRFNFVQGYNWQWIKWGLASLSASHFTQGRFPNEDTRHETT